MVLVAVSPTASPGRPWQYIVLEAGAYVSRDTLSEAFIPAPSQDRWTAPVPEISGEVSASVLADVTGDGDPEWVLLLWRPWQDWPIQKWVSAPSPLSGFRDAAGESCHLLLVDPATGREIWAGSALPAPMIALAAGDVSGDGRIEIVTLEGNYELGRGGPARRVNVWRWAEFGFTLAWRSDPVEVRELRLFGDERNGILAIGIR